MEKQVEQELSLKETIVDHEIHGVTPEMIDWWWANMEKGYPLWCPEEHKSFVWEVPPTKDMFIGAIQIAEESISGPPVRKLRIRWEDPKTSPIPIIYEHALLCAGIGPDDKPVAYLLHQYETTPYGTRMRSTFHPVTLRPQVANDAWAKHNKDEMSHFPEFLPQLFKMWQNVKDPKFNVPCNLKFKE